MSGRRSGVQTLRAGLMGPGSAVFGVVSGSSHESVRWPLATSFCQRPIAPPLQLPLTQMDRDATRCYAPLRGGAPHRSPPDRTAASHRTVTRVCGGSKLQAGHHRDGHRALTRSLQKQQHKLPCIWPGTTYSRDSAGRLWSRAGAQAGAQAEAQAQAQAGAQEPGLAVSRRVPSCLSS